jgi:hypothetical protein
MIVTAWNNGKHHSSGAGYGLKLDPSDRDRYFRRAWGHVLIELPNGVRATANIDKDSLWGAQCRELISKEIGRWLRSQGMAPWPGRRPPRLMLDPKQGNSFVLRQNRT